MAVYTTVSWQINGVTQQKGIVAQIDAANLDMKSFDAGAADYDQFMIYLSWASGYAIKRGHQLLDETNGTDLYTIANKPEIFVNGHVEIEAMLKVGT
jgi:hypothetical protein